MSVPLRVEGSPETSGNDLCPTSIHCESSLAFIDLNLVERVFPIEYANNNTTSEVDDFQSLDERELNCHVMRVHSPCNLHFGDQDDVEQSFELNQVVHVNDHFRGALFIPGGIAQVIAVRNSVYFDVRFQSDHRRENNVSARHLQQDESALNQPRRRHVRLKQGEVSITRSDVQALFARLSDPLDSSLTVLRAKQYLDADTHKSVLVKLFDLVGKSPVVQALYVQNLEQAMDDETLQLLTLACQKNQRLWALNVGENFKITRQAWEKFARALPSTGITHLYAGSESSVNGELKVFMRHCIRENRKKHTLHCSSDNLHVISQIGQMWWNPKNSALISRKKQLTANTTPIVVQRGDIVAFKRRTRSYFEVGEVEESNTKEYRIKLSALVSESISFGDMDEVYSNYMVGFAFREDEEAVVATVGAVSGWWPCLYFPCCQFVVFLHEGLEFSPQTRLRKKEFILPFDARFHPLVSQNQHREWLLTVKMCEQEFIVQ